jgi:glycosyltransferase involved in cell wall biosynthesis
VDKVPSLSFFFPAFNEEASVEPLVLKTRRLLPELARAWKIIPVNDGSTDGTGTVFARLAAGDPEHVHPVHHETNRGYGGALISGFAHARYDLIFFTDGDQQFDLGELPLLIEKADDGAVLACV